MKESQRNVLNKKNWEELVSLENISITEAMRKIDKNSRKILYLVDEKGFLTGSLSDGDIRRWILKKGDVLASVSKAAYRDVKYVYDWNRDDAERIIIGNAIDSIPVLDSKGAIIDVLYRSDYYPSEKEKVNKCLEGTVVIIMAGGIGSRLRPYTRVLPKPLIPIGETPIVERIMNRFYDYGVNEFYMTVNYKKEMIQSYFSDVSSPYQIKFVVENQPLGTAGGIRLIEDEFINPVIVTNCDILIETDYQSILEHHKNSGNDMTVVSSLKNTVIPYGVIHMGQDGTIESMEEKPEISNFINTGMYVVNPECFKKIPVGECYHMTQLAECLMKEGKQVGMYPISEDSFLDMGQLEEMKRMEERLSGR